MEDSEKLSVDLKEAKQELKNSEQGEVEEAHMQGEKLHGEDPNSFNGMGKNDQNMVENVEDGGDIRGDLSVNVEETKATNANEMEGERNSGENAVPGETKTSEYTLQVTESTPVNEIEANQSEKVNMLHDKIVTVTADVADDCNKLPENNNDRIGLVKPITTHDLVKHVGEQASSNCWNPSAKMTEEEEAGTPEEQDAFMRELERFYKGRSVDFKPPKFYQQTLNCLKLFRSVTRLGGYDRVTTFKLWRQIGESFHPPKTCTTVSWTFRIFYEKALLEYERHKLQIGELELPLAVIPEPVTVENGTPGSGRVKRDAAARAMQGWHAQRHYGYGEVGEPIIKDKNLNKREKTLKSIGSLKHKRPSEMEDQHPMKAARSRTSKQPVSMVVDIGPPADWVKINVLESKDCFEVFALVPGLLREEVRVQSDPAGRLVITGEPEQVDNPWGITAFKKVVSLPARIDPLQTSAVVSLHGQLFIRVPFEQPNS